MLLGMHRESRLAASAVSGVSVVKMDASGPDQDHFEIEPAFPSDLPGLAAFLHRWRSNQAVSAPVHSIRQPVPESAQSIERRIRWLLAENPVARPGSPLGYCVRDSSGAIRGINLCFPSAFLGGDKTLRGLGSGSFFVDPPAKSMGFYLFRKYLRSPGYSFYFATTCNTNSEPLWRMLGGRAVPDSETEYIVPLRLDALMPALVATRTSSEFASGIARIAGRGANPFLRFLALSPSAFSIEPCRDWQKLSDLFRRHRPANLITTDRSPEFLQWRYGPGSPVHPCGVYLFRDRKGNEGWFSLGNQIRGNIRGAFLLDVVWPRAKMTFSAIFQEILRAASLSGADALCFRRQAGFDYREYCRWAFPRRLEARTFVIASRDTPPIALESLDHDDNDYVAWMFPSTNAK